MGKKRPSLFTRVGEKLTVSFSALVVAAGCRGGGEIEAEAPVLSGRVRFEAKSGSPDRHPHWQNPDGTVRNVFVYVKEGLEGGSFEVPDTPVVLNQIDFQFVPRVFGVLVGQKVKFKTSDYAMHNVHCRPFDNPEFNESMLPGEEFEKVFRIPERMILFTCEHHPWMRAYMAVLPHPFFSVTGPEGAFAIPDLPPGRYVLEAWEERLGATRIGVTVVAGRKETLEIVYR